MEGYLDLVNISGKSLSTQAKHQAAALLRRQVAPLTQQGLCSLVTSDGERWEGKRFIKSEIGRKGKVVALFQFYS